MIHSYLKNELQKNCLVLKNCFYMVFNFDFECGELCYLFIGFVLLALITKTDKS